MSLEHYVKIAEQVIRILSSVVKGASARRCWSWASFTLKRWWRGLGEDRRRGVLYLVGVVFLTSALGSLTGRDARVGAEELRFLFDDDLWITFVPLEYDPLREHYPSVQSIREDLIKVRNAGFTGIVTFGSEGSLAQIPRLANELGLKVIMGIWNPSDLRELEQAACQHDHVLGYCVGHNWMRGAYVKERSLAQLEGAVIRLRNRTRLPVAVSEYIDEYGESSDTGSRIRAAGDWLFPDVHLRLFELLRHDSVDVTRDVEQYAKNVADLIDLAISEDRPLMLGSSPNSGGVDEPAAVPFYLVVVQGHQGNGSCRWRVRSLSRCWADGKGIRWERSGGCLPIRTATMC